MSTNAEGNAKGTRPRLQIALDTFDLPSALRPLQQAAQHIDVIEVGTILCLSEGMRAVREIKALFPDRPVLADVRIAEAGAVISRMAFEAGADWVSVVAGASMTTVEAVVAEAARHGGEVQIELNDTWTPEQARAWRAAGVTHAITHRSRDAERDGLPAWGPADLDNVSLLADLGFVVTVTGGVTAAELEVFAGRPVGIVIAGRAIVQAADPEKAAAELADALRRNWP
ncbi:orotidine 5'-phosphate decarboxylase / HUMPS family protein [Streptomyces sp. YIM S03343]